MYQRRRPERKLAARGLCRFRLEMEIFLEACFCMDDRVSHVQLQHRPGSRMREECDPARRHRSIDRSLSDLSVADTYATSPSVSRREDQSHPPVQRRRHKPRIRGSRGATIDALRRQLAADLSSEMIGLGKLSTAC